MGLLGRTNVSQVLGEKPDRDPAVHVGSSDWAGLLLAMAVVRENIQTSAYAWLLEANSAPSEGAFHVKQFLTTESDWKVAGDLLLEEVRNAFPVVVRTSVWEPRPADVPTIRYWRAEACLRDMGGKDIPVWTADSLITDRYRGGASRAYYMAVFNLYDLLECSEAFGSPDP